MVTHTARRSSAQRRTILLDGRQAGVLIQRSSGELPSSRADCKKNMGLQSSRIFSNSLEAQGGLFLKLYQNASRRYCICLRDTRKAKISIVYVIYRKLMSGIDLGQYFVRGALCFFRSENVFPKTNLHKPYLLLKLPH